MNSSLQFFFCSFNGIINYYLIIIITHILLSFADTFRERQQYKIFYQSFIRYNCVSTTFFLREKNNI